MNFRVVMFKKIFGFLKRINSISNRFDRSLDFSCKSNYLLGLAINSKENIVSERGETENELIVSLTTYSNRIHDVHLVIESIAQQTLKANRVILWLDKEEFTLETIPLILHKQIMRGLEIRFCPNYRSYKKLIPALQAFPDANIITIDDDILYPHDMVEMLCKEHKQYPEFIIGHRAHKIKINSYGKILPYKKWEHETSDSSAGYNIITIGVGGIFYPARILNDECLNIENITKFSPHADDIWFKAMSLLNNKKHKKVTDNRKFWNRFLSIENSQNIALSHHNVSENGNDFQIKAVFEKYHLYGKINK